MLQNVSDNNVILVDMNTSKIVFFLCTMSASYVRYFCETLQDYYDPCPVNEQLRAKVLTRLIKEGSNANDPTNIALSDYSR